MTRSAQTHLDDLVARVGALRGVEPHVSPSIREDLLAELHRLDGDLERLARRCAAGASVTLDDFRSYQRRYLWLRERLHPVTERRAA
ncbi:MAG: hypothetical protein QNJ12_10020 [Ilumatobacter sp.]|uniref:hypothetical protein n=1 Tax=Ilumatobacter sp. TaxID=1967498 RepID=UPI0026095080|nr:hypothetical protein [Ilumatobacter sp.]MDJ0769122.1 hypothetical protein [Ilumatobacter sp.]